MNLADRLKTLREKRGLSREQLAERLGLSYHAIAKYETGKRSPDQDTILKIADYFNVSVDYLLGRSDNPMPLNDDDRVLRKIGAVPVTKMYKLPVLGVIRAGEPIYAEENIIDYQEISADDIRGGEYFFLQVEGDSMINEGIRPGARVLVRRQDYVDDGSIAVVIVNSDEATIKRIKYVDGKVILLAANPTYEPMVYPADEVKIIGKVVQTIIKHE